MRIIQIEGLRKFSMARLAREVGVVPSAIYRHFRSKEEILDAILGFVRVKLKESVEEVIHHHFSAISALDALLNHHIEFITSHGAIPQVLFSEEVIGDSESRRQMLGEIIREHVECITGIVKKGQKDGEIRQDIAPETVALMVLGIVQPSAILWHTSGGTFDLTGYAREAWQAFRECVGT